jgi:hypothetical protein
MGMGETFREIQQDRLDREHNESAPDGCVEFFNASIERDVLMNDLRHYDTEKFPNETGWADRTAPVLGYLGCGVADSIRIKDMTASRGPKWAQEECDRIIAYLGFNATIGDARRAYIEHLRKRVAALKPLAEKPAGYDEWRNSYREADEETEWTDTDDRSLGRMMRRR